MAWLLKIETDSILIKEKHNHLSKMLDRVSKLMKHKRLKFGLRESSHRSIYVGIVCFESEVFNFLFSNFSFKRLVLSNLTIVSLLPRSGRGIIQ